MTEQRYRGGRKLKGERAPIMSRVLMPVAEAIRDNAETRGISVNDYVASLLAREVGMPELAPEVPVRNKVEELPIADVA